MTFLRWFVLLTYLRLLVGAGATFRKSSNRPGSFPLLITFLILIAQSRSAALFEVLAIPAIFLLIGSLVLFQWASNSIRGQFFSYIGDDDVPQFVFQKGPFAYIRNPFYASYMLANLGTALLFPTWITIGAAFASFGLLWAAAAYEEKKFSRSPCAEEYRVYMSRTGRFLPKL